MNLLHNAIKIMYVNLGYLPNIPFHLISDKEMFDAFLSDNGYFADFYPCPSEYLRNAYDLLKEGIESRITDFLENEIDIPAWVYSYMIMRPITYQSDEEDIQYLYDLTEVDSPQVLAEFGPELATACYEVSSKWIRRMPSKYGDRPPTMFGETHVTKSLRLNADNIWVDYEV